MSSPKISIITVVFNGEKHIKPTIESVIGQSFEHYEYIIIDGNSTDETMKIINSNEDRIDKIVSEPDLGVYDAMNKGLQLATGDFLLFLNAGDELVSSQTLSRIFDSLQKNTDLVYSETIILNPDREIIGTRTELTSRKLPDNLSADDFLNGQVVSHQSFIPKRSLSRPYNLKYSCSADIDWQLDIIQKARTIVKSQEPISKYLQGGISDTQLSTCWKERFQILIKYFSLYKVIKAHLNFVFRYLNYGKYKSSGS